MKYLSLSVLAVLFFITTVFSQSKFNLGASFNVNFPVGAFSDIAKTGIGGSVLGEYVFTEKISAVILGSFNSYSSTIPRIAAGGSTYDISLTSIPVMAGVRYYFQPNLFATIEAGVNFIRASADVSNIYSKEKLSTDYSSKFSSGIGGGMRFDLSKQSVFEFAGTFNYVQDNFNTIYLSATVLILLGNL